MNISLKKHGENINNPLISIYVNEIENRIAFRIKTRYYLEILFQETMRLSGRIKIRKITKGKSDGNVPPLEIAVAVLIHCNVVNNDYQQDSKVFYAFVLNRLFGQLLDIPPKKSYIWFNNQNSKPLEIESKINITWIINESVKCKK